MAQALHRRTARERIQKQVQAEHAQVLHAGARYNVGSFSLERGKGQMPRETRIAVLAELTPLGTLYSEVDGFINTG